MSDVQNITLVKVIFFTSTLTHPLSSGTGSSWCWRRTADKRAAVGTGYSGESRGRERADNNQPKSGSKDVQNITLNKKF
jgi:hypothetical protein